MRTIYFVRHAKSSWSDPSLRDIERPLNTRGKRDAPIMAQKLSEIAPSIDLMLCSPARRAQETSKYFQKEISVKNIESMDEIYHAWTTTLIDIVRGISSKVNTAIIFGHNPGFTEVYNHFSKNTLDNLPTCGIFELKCSKSWKNVEVANTKVELLLFPKMFT